MARRLRDGREVVLRAGGPADADAIAGLYLALSRESFRRRFHCARPDATVVARFARLGAGSGCVLATPRGAPGEVVAEARHVPAGAQTAELALTVRDDYQGCGLGGLLLAELIRSARESGVLRLSGDVLAGNAAMVRLMRRHGYAVAAPAEDPDEACLEISAVGGMPGWPAGSAGRRVLVEQPGWMDGARVAALRAAGWEVRRCPGPPPRQQRAAGSGCALLASGECRLAADADRIVCLLPEDEPASAPVLAAHQRHWPSKLDHSASPLLTSRHFRQRSKPATFHPCLTSVHPASQTG